MARGAIWREAENYGALGRWKTQKSLGTHNLGNPPEVGMSIEIRGDKYEVVSIGIAFCHVRPLFQKAY